jgi:hypothetical protein
VKTGARPEDKGVTLDIGVTRHLLGAGCVFFEHARS